METKHIQLDYEKAISAKKQILSSEVNLLNIVRSIKAYKLLRKKEFAEKNKLRLEISSLKSEINLIMSTFPEEERMMIHPVKVQGIQKTKKHIERKKTEKSKPKDNIEIELEDIKNKLAKLS